MAHQKNSSDAFFPLRTWIDREAQIQIRSGLQNAGFEDEKHERVLRNTTVAYGLAELLTHTRAHHNIDPSSLSCEQFNINNFVVRLGGNDQSRQKIITGVNMISPPIIMNITQPFWGHSYPEGGGDAEDQKVGRYLEVEFPTLPEAGAEIFAISQSEEDARCHSLGKIFYELFSHICLRQDESRPGKNRFTKDDGPISKWEDSVSQEIFEHKKKKTRLFDYFTSPLARNDTYTTTLEESEEKIYFRLIDLGLPSSLCLLVQNLLECGHDNDYRPDHAYDSLETVSKDLHLLLLDPKRFLFHHEPSLNKGDAQLLFRKNKLYGRENEVSLIKNAFVRVTNGKSEALFVEGFSGSGKSRLVNSLTARLDLVEGYVLTHKFDQMSKERPLLEVISVFNDLCLLIKRKRSQKDLLIVAQELMECFGADFSVLARLLPNIETISPQLNHVNSSEESGGRINIRSVCFIIQRFMKVVSSKEHPVMLFLDDLQWCDHSALALIEDILCSGSGCNYLFFIGSYRSNQVRDDHGIFRLMAGLSSSGVSTSRLSLRGLSPKDLNEMVSDALCMFPRVCEPLSDILYQKTKGNPFFVLEILRSLVDRALLEYSVEKRRWIWDEDRVSSIDVAGNVLHLLSTKMILLSECTQLALKVAACFGTKVKESVVGYLSTYSAYSHVQSGLDYAVEEGFMIKVENHFKFVHDKIREAAYSLIPDNEKNQYHYSLGMTLLSMTKGVDLDDHIFSVVDQVNHGIDTSLVQSPELRLDFAELNEMAGHKAVDSSDYSAARSYFNTAISLLPPDHWSSHYDHSRRLCFLSAKSAYSCGDVEKAQGILQEILNEAHCLVDKLDAYHLLGLILYHKQTMKEAYTLIHGVLLQLGESITSKISPQEANAMAETTANMLRGFSEESLLRMKDMEKKSQYLLQFYSSISVVALLYKPNMVPFFTCRLVQLTMDRGICKYSLIGLAQHAAEVCGHKDVSATQEACRIGKLAMAVLKHRFDSSTDIVSRLYLIYYAFVASYSEPVQSCVDNLYRGFVCGMACGDTTSGFLNACHFCRISLMAGVHLPTLLEKIEYFLDVMKSHSNMLAVTHLSLLRGTVLTLLGNDCNSDEVNGNAASVPVRRGGAALYHQAIRAFWIGHAERCYHLFAKFTEENINDSFGSRHQRSFYILYFGLNTLQLIRRTSSQKMKAVPRDALKALKVAAGCSQCNYSNKAHLIEAEIFSFEGKNEEAKKSYAAAIESANRFSFIHEEGLANERAGFHYKKIKDKKSACNFFNQAKQCYAKWGSQMKVDKVTRQLDNLQIS